MELRRRDDKDASGPVRRASDAFKDLGETRFAGRQLDLKEFVDITGVDYFRIRMSKLGWARMGATKEADLMKADALYGLGCATVYIQIKSASLITEFAYDPSRRSYRRWHWQIFEKEKGLPVEFYKESDCFLGLVGLDVREEIYERTSLMVRNERIKGFVFSRQPKIGLIPGSRVLEHFQGKAKRSNAITLKENSVSQWDEYFGRENMTRLLLGELERQTKQRLQGNE